MSVFQTHAQHPVENQLPFIQAVCPGARIVPVVIRQPSQQTAQILAEALVAALDDRPALIVASTDLSHYPDYDDAIAADHATLAAVARKAGFKHPQYMAQVFKQETGQSPGAYRAATGAAGG